MKIFTTMVTIGNEIHTMDTIEYEGQFWLVPEWLSRQELEFEIPMRIVCLSTLPHQKSSGAVNFVLNVPIPKAVLDGHVPPELAGAYIVIERPDIRFPKRGEKLH